MIKKHPVLLPLLFSTILMAVATLRYLGCSLADPNSTGCDWAKNFFTNLFAENPINGSLNAARTWALVGIAFYSFG